MEAESFFQRWSRKKAADNDAQQVSAGTEQTMPAAEPDKPPPTLDDLAKLTPDSDFKPFVARGVDEEVRRSALKKLFADPHFNIMDGLDIYIDDYTKPDPIPPAMLAAMHHAKALLNPGGQIEKALMQMLDEPNVETQPQANDEAASDADPADDAAEAPREAADGNNTETSTDKPANDDAI